MFETTEKNLKSNDELTYNLGDLQEFALLRIDNEINRLKRVYDKLTKGMFINSIKSL